jgi:uncharacterized protein (UPF0335 family)
VIVNLKLWHAEEESHDPELKESGPENDARLAEVTRKINRLNLERSKIKSAINELYGEDPEVKLYQ